LRNLNAIVQAVSVGVFLGSMAHAAASDLVRYEIPNWAPAAAAAAFLPFAHAVGWGGFALALHLAAGVVVLAVGALLFTSGVIGGGDAKLLAAAAVWMGWDELVPFVLAVAIAGGLLSFALLAFRTRRLPAALAARPWIGRLHAKDQGVPYGVAIAAAAILLFLREFSAAVS
jgi:prepilin peptidase CpaA